MSMQFNLFDKKVEELAILGRPKLAFGLIEPNSEILESLKMGTKYADIILVGPSAIEPVSEFEKIIDDEPEEKLAEILANDEVDGIIRGTIDDFKTIEAYERMTGEKNLFCPGLMESALGHQFFLAPASNPEAWTKEERLELVKNIANFIKSWGIEPKIAVLAGTRHETYARKKDIKEGVTGILNKSYEDADWLVEKFTKEGYEAKNWAIDSNVAIEEGYNLVTPVNGNVGNQMFRMLLLSGGKILSTTRVDLSRHYEDNSRTEKDFLYHVKWITALINKSKEHK